MTTIYTIGHSTHPFAKFVELLHAHDITLLADIRTIPKSRRNPQFNREALEIELPKTKIAYRHLKGLGGLRRPSKDSVNTAWENASFRGYADYMQTKEFDHTLQHLVALAKTARMVIMCAEGNPFRCHRLLVADALTARRARVAHFVAQDSKGTSGHAVRASERHPNHISQGGSMNVKTHKPKSVIWIIAFLLFLYALVGFFVPMLPLALVAALVSAALLLLGTTVF